MKEEIDTTLPLMASPENLGKKKSIPVSPKTPRDEGYESESRLESLPLEILVFDSLIICTYLFDLFIYLSF
jgi:hypothetical protein